MRKAVFQNWMVLDIITPLKGGTRAIIQNIVAHNWYIVFVKSHKNTSECSEGSEPQSKRIHKSVLLVGAGRKKLLSLGIIILICVFSRYITAVASASSAARMPLNEIPPC